MQTVRTSLTRATTPAAVDRLRGEHSTWRLAVAGCEAGAAIVGIAGEDDVERVGGGGDGARSPRPAVRPHQGVKVAGPIVDLLTWRADACSNKGR